MEASLSKWKIVPIIILLTGWQDQLAKLGLLPILGCTAKAKVTSRFEEVIEIEVAVV